MPESTPTVGRWVLPRRTWWQCECGATLAAAYAECPECGTVRPPLPETPAPRVDDALCVCGHAASAHSCNGGVGDAECGCESFAALRAVPVEGGEPWGHVVLDEQGHLCGEVHRFEDSRARAEQYCAFLRVNPAQRVRVVPLYAHPAPDGESHDPEMAESAFNALREAVFIAQGEGWTHDFDPLGWIAQFYNASAPTPTPEDRPDAR